MLKRERKRKMLQEYECSEFIASFLTKEKTNTVKYNICKLTKIIKKIEQEYPEIRINFGLQSLQRMCIQCENITHNKYFIVIDKLDSLTTRLFISHNKPSIKTRKIFLKFYD